MHLGGLEITEKYQATAVEEHGTMDPMIGGLSQGGQREHLKATFFKSFPPVLQEIHLKIDIYSKRKS